MPIDWGAEANEGQALVQSNMKLGDDLTWRVREGRCPSCLSPVSISKFQTSSIDECGFENYKITCRECGASLVAIIDPRDCEPLISEVK
jgi:hypothetical protein